MSAAGPAPASARILETGFGTGLNFLAAWQAWKLDPARPRMLHYVGTTAQPPEASALVAAAPPALRAMAGQLAAQWYGLLPGFHRMVFEEGQVLLTLCVGDARSLLREQDFGADAVLLHEPAAPAGSWDLHALKSVARLCRRGATLAAVPGHEELLPHLASCGFVPAVQNETGWRTVYAPSWEPRGAKTRMTEPTHCVVVGGGLAGAAAANSLARRGWHVRLLDAAPLPASGASGLPAGLLAPHQSPDDSLLSRLVRSGVRITLQQAAALLHEGQDWQRSGALEHRADAQAALPGARKPALGAWSVEASAQQLHQAWLDVDAPALWHEQAAWIKPAALVRAWLDHPRIAWLGNAKVARLVRDPAGWRLLGETGDELAQAPLVVLAAAHASAALLPQPPALQPVRGQVSWGLADPHTRLPAFPMHGNGHLLPRIPMPGGDVWLCGASYARDEINLAENAPDHADNLTRLRELAPRTARQLAPAFEAGKVQAWVQLRCVSSDRRPLIGEMAPGLWLSTAMGSRGLSFAALCAELMAARLHGEPLPLPRKLATALDARRHL